MVATAANERLNRLRIDVSARLEQMELISFRSKFRSNIKVFSPTGVYLVSTLAASAGNNSAE
jgi:hypothetical protein